MLKNGKLFGKINVIDFLAILAVVVVIAAAAVFVLRRRTAAIRLSSNSALKK